MHAPPPGSDTPPTLFLIDGFPRNVDNLQAHLPEWTRCLPEYTRCLPEWTAASGTDCCLHRAGPSITRREELNCWISLN